MSQVAELAPETRLEDQVAVVTGGGRGVGRAAAIRLAGAGASVMVTARTDSEIEVTAERIRNGGGTPGAWLANMSDWEALLDLVQETKRLFGIPGIVVANADAIEPVGAAWEVAPEAWAKNPQTGSAGRGLGPASIRSPRRLM